MRIYIYREALGEWTEAAQYYDEKVAGLGDDFTDAIVQAIERILRFPSAGADLGDGIRSKIIAAFPYKIIYALVEDFLLVLAIAHQHRRPDYWRERLHR
ncbi:MAG: type II toxin-antitoxin system RelE/ParE family toxin [Candidatus Hydrogenedentes bacterium]|nr:type II toxin-antitoxin system RelE/ParE family toxin [Candidatus Hydrogenedentota bacterium]